MTAEEHSQEMGGLSCEELDGAETVPEKIGQQEPQPPHSTPKPGMPQPQGKHKPAPRPPKKGQFKCPRCSKLLMGDQFPVGSRFCFPCKKIKDALYKAARRSNDQEWLGKVMSSDQSTKKAFDQYRSLEGRPSEERVCQTMNQHEESVTNTRVKQQMCFIICVLVVESSTSKHM